MSVKASDAQPLAEPVTEDYRSDRLILEELSANVREIRRLLQEYEPHARRLLEGNPLDKMVRMMWSRYLAGGKL